MNNYEEKYFYSRIFNLITTTTLFIVLFMRGCSGSEIPINSKPISKTFESSKPTHTIITDTVVLTKYVKSDKSNVQYIEQLKDKIYNIQYSNDSLVANFKNVHDTIKIKEYEKATQLNLFDKTFEDNFIKADINGVVQGEVKDLGFTYTRKPQPIPQVKFRLLAGLGISTNQSLNASLGFQNSKGSILEVGYDTNRNFNLGYKVSLFKIVK
jgi:hypothetical protein